jgi:hypothetical protein
MLEQLADAFAHEPRITEAWLKGERLTPEDGSPSWEATEVVLVLDPPLPDKPEEIATEIAAIERSLASTGWVRVGRRERAWVYAPHDGRAQRHGTRIYHRDADTH